MSTGGVPRGSGHGALLKEAGKGKRDFPFRTGKAVIAFGNAEAVISGNKGFRYRISCFRLL